MEQPTNTTDTKNRATQIVPEVTWAQRSSKTDAEKNHVFLTIVVPDVTPANLKLDLQPTSLDFTGHSESRKATYHVKLDFYAEIDPKESKINHTTRAVELVLRKKELQEEFWPRLTKEKAKYHFLKTDFDKWVDEDEQDDIADDDDYMSKMGGMGGMEGMGGMPGMGGMGGGMGGMGGMGGEGFGGIDFSKLGGAGGMPDLSSLAGMGGMGGMGGEDDDDDDEDDMPELENEEEASSSAKSSKIQEVE